MADGPLENVVHELRRIAGLTEAATLADGRLLEVFSATSEPAALEVLVRRYGPMVFGVCRRVLRHTQDAEDAFQATFLVLVRKAAGLRRGETLGNWLYGVAYRTALQARTRSARRRRIEAGAPPMDTENSALESAAQLEIQALLDRELNRLPEKFRSPIILCDLLGKTLKQAAVELRCPEGTVSSRLARGRERLKKQLEHHAPTLAKEPFGNSMTAALPVGLCATTVKAAVLVANGTTMASLSPSVAAIVQGVMKSMLITKLKPAVMLFIGFGLLSGMTYVVASGMGVGSGPGDVADKGKAEKPAPAVLVAEREAPAVAEVQPPPKVQEKQKKRLLYDGKDFNAWLDVLQNELKPEVRVDAIKALGAFGVNGYGAEATAAIIEEMRKHDAEKEDSNMSGFGSRSPVLKAAREVLKTIGDVALFALVKELESKNPNERRLAAQSLGHFPSKTTEPQMLRALKDDDRWVRNTALKAINSPYSDEIRGLTSNLSAAEKQALVQLLTSIVVDQKDTANAREDGILLLRRLGPESKTALPALIKVLEEDDSAWMQTLAADTIGRLGPLAKDAVPALIGVLKDKSSNPKSKAGGKKGGVGGPPKSKQDNTLLYTVIEALGRIGLAAKETVPALIATLGDDNPALAKSAKSALIKVGPGAVPQLVAALKSKPDDKIRNQVVDILGESGPAAVEAVPVLIIELNNDDDQSGLIWALAARTLGKIGPGAKEAVPAIASRMLKDSAAARRLDMLNALKQIGPPPSEVVPRLVQVLMNTKRISEPRELEFTIATIDYLGNQGPEAKEAVPALTRLTDATWSPKSNDSRQLKEAVAKALEKIQK